jgi:pimeloyl-ACP methyl ester carboxylesterase
VAAGQCFSRDRPAVSVPRGLARRRRGSPPALHRGGSGSPLLLLHPIAATWRVWQRALPALEAHHDVIAPTLPGHRGADPLLASGSFSIAALTDVVEQHLDVADVDTAHVAGNSLGGWIALELARRGRARSVTAIAPAGGAANRSEVLRTAMVLAGGYTVFARIAPAFAPLLRLGAVRRGLVGRATGDPLALDAAEAASALRDALGATGFAPIVASALLAGPFTAMEDPGCPVVIAWPQRDRILSLDRHGRPLLDRIAGARLVELPSAGHVPMMSHPELVAATILAVTRSVDS